MNVASFGNGTNTVSLPPVISGSSKRRNVMDRRALLTHLVEVFISRMTSSACRHKMR